MQEGKARLMQPVALLCRQSIHQGLQMGLGKTHSLPLRPLCRVVIPDPVVSRWHLPKISANQGNTHATHTHTRLGIHVAATHPVLDQPGWTSSLEDQLPGQGPSGLKAFLFVLLFFEL